MARKEQLIQATRTIVKGLLSLTDEQVIPADAPGTRPALPYLVVSAVVWDISEGADERLRAINGSGNPTVKIRGRRSATVQIEAFGDDAEGWLEQLKLAFWTEAASDLMATAGVALRAIGGPQNTTAVRDTGFEQRAIEEFEATYAIEGSEIEEVELQLVDIDVELDSDGDGIADYTDTITVSV